jgi:hypothetical protein
MTEKDLKDIDDPIIIRKRKREQNDDDEETQTKKKKRKIKDETSPQKRRTDLELYRKFVNSKESLKKEFAKFIE